MIDRIPLNKKKIGTSSVVYILFILFYISGSNSVIHNYIQISIFILWLIVAMFEDNQSFISALKSRATKYLVLFLLYYLITSSFVADFAYTIKYLAIFIMMYSCYLPYMYYVKRARIKEIKIISISSLIGWIGFTLLALSFYELNPSAARMLAADFTAFENLYIGGGYAIAFGSAILIVCLFSILLNRKINTKKEQMATIIFIVLLFFLLIKTESTTTLLATIIGIILSLYYSLKKSNSPVLKLLLVVVIIGLIFFILAGGLQSFGGYLASQTSDGTDDLLTRRFNRIGEKLSGSALGSDNYVNERWGLVTLSWNTFLQHPIFGMGYTIGNTFSQLESNGVGTHSEICDMLAQHGIIGVYLFIRYFFSALKTVSKNKMYDNGYIFTIFIMALMNPFKYFHVYFAILTLMPLISLYLIYRKQSVKSNSKKHAFN